MRGRGRVRGKEEVAGGGVGVEEVLSEKVLELYNDVTQPGPR